MTNHRNEPKVLHSHKNARKKSNTFEFVFYEQYQHRLMSLINSLLNAPQPCFDNHLTQASISFFGRLLSSNTNHHKVQRVSNSYSIQWYPRSCFLDWSQNEIKSPSLSQTETRPSKNAVDSEPRPSKSGLGTSADLEYYNAIGSTTRDLVFSASFENNYTYCICCSVWFALASLKDSQGTWTKKDRNLQRLSSHLPRPGFFFLTASRSS